jgi:amino acid adenylation domain-containing protein
MDQVQNIIEELRSVNAKIFVDGGNLRIDSKKGAVSDRLKLLIRDNKESLIQHINEVRKADTGTIPVVPVQESYPLSSPQRRLWVLSRFGEANAAYNMPAAHVFEGELNREALQLSFHGLIERHESLRTVFREDGQGEPRQFILPPERSGFTIEFHDLRNTDPAAAEQLVRDEMSRPFNLEQGPLFRALLLQVDSNRWIFTYVMHHIISDGWSMQILIRELLMLYNSHVSGTPAPLQPLRIQYKDYTAWQHQQLSGENLRRQKQYWLKQFEGTLPVLELPGKSRPAVQTHNGASVNARLGREATQILKELCQQQGATLFMGLLATVKALFYHYAGQQDIVIGTPIAGREHADLEDQIGFYLNTLALRTRFNPEASFRELLEQVKEVTLGAFAHQAYPFDELVEALQVKRDRSRNPIFDVMVILQNTQLSSAPTQGPAGLEIKPYRGESQESSKFDLLFAFTEAEGEIGMGIQYNTDIYDAETMERMAHHFEGLLLHLPLHREQPLKTLDYLRDPEKQQLLFEFNNTETAFPQDKTIPRLFEEQAARTPDATALVFGEKTFTYKELNEQSNRLAHYFRSNHVLRPDDLVAVKVGRSEKLIISLLAVLKSGAACVSIDASLPQERTGYILEDSGCKLVMDEEQFGSFTQQASEYGSENPSPSGLLPSHPAFVIYTSGSTGRPKGCMLEHRGIINHLYSKISLLQLKEGSAICHNSQLHFVGGIWQLWAPLITGGKVALCNDEELKDIDLLLQAAARHGADMIEVIPSQLNERLFREGSIDLRHLQTLILTGEKLTPHFVRRCYKGNMHLRIINTYGQTECSDVTTSYHVPPEVPDGPVLIGRPIQNTYMYVLSPGGTLCPIGVPGELCTGGIGVGHGYLNQEEMTAQKFVENPFRPGERMYRTGDVGRWLPDGTLEISGRKDDQVKIRGYRIETGEIQQALLRYEGVNEVVLLLNEGEEKSLTACIVSSRKLNVTDLRTYLSRHIPEYMIPARFAQLESIPLLPNGKVDKKAIAEMKGAEMDLGVEYVAPRNETEERLVDLWKQLLRKEQIGIHDHFFELGGHSLLMIRLVNVVNKSFAPKNLRLPDLLKYPTVAQLATFLDTSDTPRQPSNPYIIELRGGNHDHVSFIIPGMPGISEGYVEMARRIPLPGAVYGLQMKGFMGEAAPLEKLEDMAAHNIALMREAAAGKRVSIYAHSYGGRVTYEMLRQWENTGLKLEEIIVIESYPVQRNEQQHNAEAEIHFIRFFLANMGVNYEGSQEEIEEALEQPREQWQELLGKLVSEKAGLELKTFNSLWSLMERSLGVECCYGGKLPYSVTLVLAGQEGLMEMHQPGWEAYYRDVRILYSAGDHFSIVKEPYCSQWLPLTVQQ